jgi:hypothetical protein
MSIEVITDASQRTVQMRDGIRLGPDAALVLDPNGSSAVLDMNGEFYGISAIGALMLKGALACGRRMTAQILAKRFGVEPSRIAADLDRLIDDLHKRGVVEGRSASKAIGQDAGARFAAALLAGVFRITRRNRPRAAASLALSRLSFALFGWKATIGAWRVRFPESEGVVEPAKAREIDNVVRRVSARNWIGADCKERALSCFSLARAAGLPASLHIGIALYPLGGHCWCKIGDHLVSDDAERCDKFLPVFRYV